MFRSIQRFAAVIFALVFALSMLGGAGSAYAKTDSSAQVTISAAQDAFSANQDVVVTVTITNPGKNTLRVLKWFTPAEEVEEPIFVVSVDGAPVDYTGPVYKRPAPQGSDYISLKAGQSLTRTVTLSSYYDLSATGSYSIRYMAGAVDLYLDEKGGSKNPGSLTSNEIALKVEGRVAKRSTPVPPPPGGTNFSSCTVDQQALLVTARTEAKNYSTGALSYMGRALGPRYITWFGGITDSRAAAVTNHYTKIEDAFINAGITFNCGCKQPYYAYVYPDKPYEITVCKVFWQAPMIGTDSKAGTLIHEMSHFYVVAGTDDYVYGQSGAMQLAIDNADQAVMNADNHEYFAENNPAKD